MVEACQNKQTQYQTERRVLHSFKKFNNASNAKCFVASTARYSHNQMDGKVTFLTAEQLFDDNVAQTDSNQEQKQLPQTQFFESQTGCGDSVVLKIDGQAFLVSGFDDGVVCLLNLQ